MSKAKQKTFVEVRNLVQKRFISEKKKVNLKLQIEKKILDYEIIETN